MARIITASIVAIATIGLAGGCTEVARLPVSAGTGPEPQLPAPVQTTIPTVRPAKAIGWPDGLRPVAAPGLSVTSFATGLSHPRWLYVVPNGDVLVAESNAPPKGDQARPAGFDPAAARAAAQLCGWPDADNIGPVPAQGGLGAWFRQKAMKIVMGWAGAGTPSADRISLLRDADGDGIAEERHAFLTGLMSPFGMVLVDDRLYVANADELVSFPYRAGERRIDATAIPLVALPGGPLNHHWTKNVVANAAGTKLYVSVGSNSNVGENGLAAEIGRAAIWEIDRLSGAAQVFACGLRNPVGMAWEPSTGTLWTTVNERDELGSDLVPDYMTSVVPGGFYGWPYFYFGRHEDTRVQPRRPDLAANSRAPDYALGPHTASLGLTFAIGAKLPAPFVAGAFVGQHGSWNRHPRSGYKVIFVPFRGGSPSGQPIDVLTGFLSADEQAYGRPVGVAIAKDGALLVADDVGNTIWRVSSAAAAATSSPR